jgi:hypothetical protein
MPEPSGLVDPLGWVAGLQSDFFVYDGLESVTFISQRNDGAMKDYVASAKRRALTTREQAASAGAYEAADVSWIVPDQFIRPGMTPKPGDVVIDSDQNRYTVLEVNSIKLRNDWRLITRNLSISYQLGHYVDLQKAAVSYDRAGVEVQSYPEDGGGSVPYANLLCRVQLATEVEVDERLIRGFAGDYLIYLSQQIVFTADYNRFRVRWVDRGITHFFDILGYKQAEQIAELPILECRIKP